jgi:putative adhesin
MPKFETPTPIAAVLDLTAGRLQLIAGDRTDTVVEVRPADATKKRDVRAAEQSTVVYADGVLRIHTPAEGNQLLGPSGSLEITVQLPTGSRVEAKAGAYELRGVGRLGDLTFDGAYRDIKIDEAASVHLTAVDGNIEVGRLTGPAQISTARGDIQIHEAVRGAVVLQTSSGNISITAAAGVSAALEAGTALGRVTNTLQNDGTTALDIRATTARGDITARSR